ncbi:DUF4148 domain-containing protein [Paraburkholderia domus]|uniref:DUF4148 domain-containing protein n=1 Tax=Paraburkholderia domus TaxID=2793075 RepID=UPI0019145540|nr:DUF4148 domain-containing protein [Paraburkholderia domus]MBK5052293.1 DUF4148 domain-containing protein [Burkholderia sp. R-70006]MBK5182128.1 DUF4148 domain-containing protein [Burkholderia sp. R-69749]MCI0151268.1 DUF4148 domain-containing protein [Paraburkholderia sediminicola]CAE6806265.1 hypothetical protein R70006_05540 [Paraburkholderia domus]CAE6841382.1 hypothetical protein R69749_04471 [Paraburkholderia domus]
MQLLNRRPAAVIAALVLPVAAFAQSAQPVSRAQVQAEMSQLEKVGYNPASRNDATYPVEIQAAGSRLSTQATTASDITVSPYSAPIAVSK